MFALPDEEFIRALYLELLGREADAKGIGYFLKILQHKKYPRKFVVKCIKDSLEYRLNHAKSDVPRLAAANQKLNDEEVAAGKTELRSSPVTFNLDLIGLCNMKPPCAMCLNWVGEKGPRHHPGLTADDVKAFGEPLRLASDIINCSIGEPLILNDLVATSNSWLPGRSRSGSTLTKTAIRWAVVTWESRLETREKKACWPFGTVPGCRRSGKRWRRESCPGNAGNMSPVPLCAPI